MEIREWAIRILSADSLEEKLFLPEILIDDQSGPAMVWGEPTRPSGMSFSKRGKEDKLPSLHEHGDAEKRAICLHRFAGHELLAVEIMAYVLLAYPDAPKTFRRGLVHTLKEEQGHVKLYMERMKAFNIQFGDLPLYKHFWKHTPYIQSPKDYVCMMSLTFEMANLDFAPMYGRSFAKFGDLESAQLMATILKDEIGHVGFGWNWLKRFNEGGCNEWDLWNETLSNTLLTPKRARGFQLNEESRLKAGIPEEWIVNLRH